MIVTKKREFYIAKKIMKKLVKLCLHLGYIVHNSFHFDDIFFHGKFQNFKITNLAVFNYNRHLTVILGNIGIKIDLSL